MKIVVLGATGMLGSAVVEHMSEVFGKEQIHGSYRESSFFPKDQFENGFEFKLPALEYTLHKIPKNTDYVINCIGIIKPFVETVGILNTIRINSVFPHQLEEYCQSRDIKLIHITTDCVFSGKKGNYVESDFHDCDDIYGKTKSLGEPVKHAMTIRTSIIGEEAHKNASLVEWVKSQKGKEVRGFNNHLWNGITTNQYAKVCEQIIKEDRWEPGLLHLFSPISVTKEELLYLIDERFNLGLTIHSVEAPIAVDRTLSSINGLELMLDVDSLHNQIREM